MNNLIIAQNYKTFGDAGLTSNKVIYYKEDNMVKFRANITDEPFGESEVVTVSGALEAVLKGQKEEIVLPIGLENLMYLFYNNDSVKKVTIPNEYNNKFMHHMFEGANNLSEVNLPSNLPTIYESMFQNCRSLANIELPNTVSTIGKNSFYNCAFTTLDFLPTSITSIGQSAFGQTKITNADLSNLTNLTTIETGAFSNTPLTSVNLSGTKITTISSIFSNCKNLSNVILPNTSTAIYGNAFQNCTALTKIDIPNSVTTISNNAFSTATNLVEVNFGNSRTTVPSISTNSFKATTSNLKFIVPNDMYDTWKAANVWNTTNYVNKIVKYSDYYNE